MMTSRKIGSCFVMEPSQARPQNVAAMKNGRIGMMTFSTTFKTICWNSCRTAVIVFAFVQTAARPTRT